MAESGWWEGRRFRYLGLDVEWGGGKCIGIRGGGEDIYRRVTYPA